MTSTDLRGDCAQCAALCCVALAFDRSALFAVDKPAGAPCANLSPQGRCAIHAERAAQGFAGCQAYDCLGAGQIVTQALFQGRSWQDEPALLGPMMQGFAAVRPAQEMRLLVDQALTMDLPRAARSGLEAHGHALAPRGGWTWAEVKDGRIDRAVEAARLFLRSLEPLLRPSPSEPSPAGRRSGPGPCRS
jgi:hypothetical protein